MLRTRFATKTILCARNIISSQVLYPASAAYLAFRVHKQCRFVLLVIQEAFDGDELLQDVLVDFVVTVYPRVVSELRSVCFFRDATSPCV